MRKLSFDGVDVLFPFDPYPSQELYIQRVLSTLTNKHDAVLESPTGTGKTLSLLTAVLSFRATIDPKPRIIYASRTHTQLAQVVRELKRLKTTSSVYEIEMGVMAGRNKACIQPDVIKEHSASVQQALCRSMCTRNKCSFKLTLDSRGEQVVNEMNAAHSGIADIEDIVQWGRSERVCPYYLTRKMARSAELLLVPYNYLLDPNLRRRHKIDVADKIIIIDEAHNVESVCEEAYSMSLKSTDIEASLDECDEMLKLVKAGGSTTQENQSDDLHEQVRNLRSSLVDLKKVLNDEFAGNIDQESTLVQLRDAFNRAQLLIKTQDAMETVDDFVFKLQKQLADLGGLGRGQKIGELVELMRYFYLNPTDKEKMAVYVRRQEEPRGRRFSELFRRCTATGLALHIDVWCFDASRAIRALKDEQVSSMIFTSGTLSPLTHYISEMGLDMRTTVRLTGTHVIEPQQLLVGTVPMSNGVELKNVFQNRENRSMFVEMGSIVKQVQSVTRGGVLVFHPTYKLMNLATEYWSELQLDSLFNESTDNMELTMAQFENALMMKKTPILQGVCRGKISEGVDFADHRGRCCFITGVPYAPVMDPKVKLKIAAVGKRYNWYQIQAMRAINQAVGRIIRHRYDYGVIVFLDSRFRQFNMRKYLPKWMEANHQVFESGEQLRLKVRVFFNKLAALSKRWMRPELPALLVNKALDQGGDKLATKMESKKLADQTLTEDHMELINAELARKFPVKAEWKRAATATNDAPDMPAPKRQKRSLSTDSRYTELCGHIDKGTEKPLGCMDTMDTRERRDELKYFLIFVKGILNRAQCDTNVWFDFKCELTAVLFTNDLEYETALAFIDKWTQLLKPQLGHYLTRVILVFVVRLLNHMQPDCDWLDELDTGDISYKNAWREISPVAIYFTTTASSTASQRQEK